MGRMRVISSALQRRSVASEDMTIWHQTLCSRHFEPPLCSTLAHGEEGGGWVDGNVGRVYVAKHGVNNGVASGGWRRKTRNKTKQKQILPDDLVRLGVVSSSRSLFEIKEARSCFRNRSYLVDYMGCPGDEEPGYK